MSTIPNMLLFGEETERLKFRKLTDADFEPWKRFFEIDNPAIFVGMDPDMPVQDLTELWFERSYARYDNNLGGMNALIEKATGDLIGLCGLLIQTVQEKDHLEIGYSLLPQHRGKGYAIEAARKCRDYAFERNVPELISVIHVDNHASAKVAMKNGMQVKYPNIDFKGSPVNIYGISRSHWLNMK